jgi:hypothetical protein
MGAKLADFDNDGRLDIRKRTASSPARPETTYWYDLQEMVTQLKNATADAADWPVMGPRDLSGYERNRLWLQLPPERGELRFAEVAEQAGVSDLFNGRGVALLDADNDGDLDVYIANQGKSATFYRNLLYAGTRRDARHWLGLRSRRRPAVERGGTGARWASSVDAVGARAVVRCGGIASRRDVRRNRSPHRRSTVVLRARSLRSAESIEIDWPSGRVSTIGADKAKAMVDRMTRITEASE